MREPVWRHMPGGGLVPFVYEPSAAEVMAFRRVAHERDASARRRGLKDKHGASSNPEVGLRLHVLGIAGETAFARFQGMDDWVPTVDTFRSMPDVGEFEVRCRSQHRYDLLVRHDDHDDARFILATCEDLRSVNVWGWLQGEHAKQERFEQRHGEREAAYFVPKHELHPLDLLPWKGVTDA